MRIHRNIMKSLPFLTVVGLFGSPPVMAHDFDFTTVLVVFKADGTYQIDLTLDVDALVAGVSPTTDSLELTAYLRSIPALELENKIEAAEAAIDRRVRVRFDEEPADSIICFPFRGTELVDSPLGPSMLGSMVRMEGRIPESAKSFTIGFSRTFREVDLTILDQKTATGVRHLLGISEESPPFLLGKEVAPADREVLIVRYIILGFEHILPLGLDHILFVLGLFLLSTKIRPLLWQVTAFTIAHSVTLALAICNVISLPSRIVESLIALSIAYVAIENMLTSKLKPWRPAVVFSFGLLHGLGFAGVLRELGLPEQDFFVSLIAFNVGVELGQITVVLLAFFSIGWFRRKPWYRASIVLPISALIALTGLYWSVQRAFFGV